MRRKLINPRPRTIKWELQVDEIAEQVATLAKIKGGVSEYLTRLVLKDIKGKKSASLLRSMRPDLLPQ